MSELEKPIIEYPDSYPPEACEDIAYRDERIKELEAELEQCLDCCKYVGEVEEERDRVMRENGKLNCHIDDLEEENERLKEAIKHAARILSFGGDVEVMHYLQEALKDQT